ncbi:MAG: protein kinase [Nannocystaceae bacterium]
MSGKSDSAGSASLTWVGDEESSAAGGSRTAGGADAKTPVHGDNLQFLDFASHKRFSIRRRLGAGGMGVVYEALDRERGEWVALKTLLGVSPLALYRFKREFRALSDVSHPNLITLHELFSEGEQIFFTMEFIDGVDFVEYVRGPDPDDPEQHDALYERLRSALRQLAGGLGAIHAAGKLHRDIKPSNVLVNTKGRVVLLDFGLVSESVVETMRSSGGDMVGTPAYISPEQAGGGEASAASDWYAVGVMTYLALTGELPFRGKGLTMLLAKQENDAKPPSELVTGIPEELEELCLDLLSRDPTKRPGAGEILRRLGLGPGEVALVEVGPDNNLFVGREYHLRLLHEAFDATHRGRPVAIQVYGRSGMGKTALVRRFLAGLRQSDGAIVLTGRCYERESVSFKALDSLIDSLCHYLMRLPDARAAELMPRDILALARVFPVLQRVRAVAEAPRRAAEIPDPRELRRRAFAALKEILARIADRRSLVLHIDDLQWGDRDSAVALADLLRPPDAPALFLILSYRSESLATSSLFRSLIEHSRDEIDIRELEVGPLALEEAAELAQAWIGRAARQQAEGGRPTRVRARQIAREAEGCPLFVNELVRHAASGGEAQSKRGGEVLLEQVIGDRLDRVGREARRLLEIIAIFGGPLEQRLALQAARIEDEARSTIAALRSEHLILTHTDNDVPMVEIYHDRVREIVRSRLSRDELKLRHRQLAFTMEQTGNYDSDTLAVHFREAGEWERAGDYAQIAADAAAEALAFDRAARLYRLALELKPHSDPRRSELLCTLADALANGGRGGRAAKIYLEAAEMAPPDQSLDLRRRAAEQYLRTGHVADGLGALRSVGEAVGVALPESQRSAATSLMVERMRLRLRRLTLRERPAAEIPADERMKMSVFRSIASGMSTIDPTISALFHARHLILSLKSGHTYEAAAALATEVGYLSLAGIKNRERTERIATAAQALVQKVEDPLPRALLAMNRGCAALNIGRWQDSVSLFERAEEVYRNECVGVSYEITMTSAFRLIALFFLGRVGELGERLSNGLIEARERDDTWGEITLSAGPQNVYWLAQDDPDRARIELIQASSRWSEGGYAIQRLWTFIAHVHIDLYSFEGLTAWHRLSRRWDNLIHSHAWETQWYRVMFTFLRASAALSVLRGGKGVIEHDGLQSLIAEDRHFLEREKVLWARPLAELIGASLAAARRDEKGTISALRAAEQGFRAVDMALYAAVARRLCGLLSGGAQGEEMVASAEAYLAEEGIINPDGVTRMIAPGIKIPKHGSSLSGPITGSAAATRLDNEIPT